MSEEVLDTKVHFFDPYMRGEFIQAQEITDRHLKRKPKKVLYTEEEKLEISSEARNLYLYSDDDLEILKTKVAYYGRDLKAVPIDGDCLLHAIRDQTEINPLWGILENRQTLDFYLAKLPEQFYMYAEPYCEGQSFESYVRNFFRGYSYGDELIAGVWGHIWNIKITIVTPTNPDLKIFHLDDDMPDVVIVHNGRPDPDGHYFSTRMHDSRSKRLPVIGSNHSYKISELTDLKHHYRLAEEHYKEVKRQQCIHDYNTAVDELGTLYDHVMHAKEEELELSVALEKAIEARKTMEKWVKSGQDRLLLAKAKMQQAGVSMSELHKMKPVSKGTQIELPKTSQVSETSGQLQPVVMIPETEEDAAVKAMIVSEKQKPDEVGLNILPGISKEYVGILPEGTIAVVSKSTAPVKTATSTVVASTSTAPAVNPGVPIEVEVINLTEGETESAEKEKPIPEGFKGTKWHHTIEKCDLKTIEGQKAPKRFFCKKCMDRGAEIGYTKRNDLVKHLETCGQVKEKKYVCDYKDCGKSYMRYDNLRQHIAKDHTKQELYKCKKCNKGFHTSPEATAHRKICYPSKPDDNHVAQDLEEDDTGEKGEKGDGGEKGDIGEKDD